MARRGLSLVEVCLAALIIGGSALVVIELMRSSTVSLEVTEAELAARSLGADILERFAGQPFIKDNGMQKVAKITLGAPVPWDQIVSEDEWLKHAYPLDRLKPLLDTAEVKVQLDAGPSKHARFAGTKGMDLYTVRVTWADRFDLRKEAVFARLVDR